MDRRDLLKFTVAGAAAGLLGMTRIPETSAEGGTLNVLWVHGTSFQAEDAGVLTGIERVGWGTLFRGKPKAFTWFHISIPTPVIMNDVRPSLEKVFVFYKTNGASIRNVHLYDGPRKVWAFDGLMLQGDRSGAIAPDNTWSLSPPLTIRFGLGISVGVQFAVGFDSSVPTEILFTTAGADFRIKPVGLLEKQKIREGIRTTPRP
jgi:hypothetical protein